MKEKIFIFYIIDKESGEKCFSLEVIGKTEQGARAGLNKAYGKKILNLARMEGKATAFCMPFHFFKAELVKTIDF